MCLTLSMEHGWGILHWATSPKSSVPIVFVLLRISSSLRIGILLVAYFFATSTDAPWWATVLIFIASMIFSRILFKFIKSKSGPKQSPSE